jgi:hypothetical protein
MLERYVVCRHERRLPILNTREASNSPVDAATDPRAMLSTGRSKDVKNHVKGRRETSTAQLFDAQTSYRDAKASSGPVMLLSLSD